VASEAATLMMLEGQIIH